MAGTATGIGQGAFVNHHHIFPSQFSQMIGYRIPYDPCADYHHLGMF
jgi:hypothetical protein